MMYPRLGTPVRNSIPPPAFHQPASNDCNPSYINGSHLPFPNQAYFTPPCPVQYPYQEYCNFTPVDTRFTQQCKGRNDRQRNGFQTPVGTPMSPMNMPASFTPYNGQFSYPPPMPHPVQYSSVPPNGMIMSQFPNPPPMPYPAQYSSAPPNGKIMNQFLYPTQPPITNRNAGTRMNGRNFNTVRQDGRKFIHEKKVSFHCSSCDKNFSSAQKLDQHVAEHISCCLEGCTFKAHPTIIEKHIAMQHRNGLFKRIIKGDSPEEIRKWVIDRKKHYPTAGKIVEKQVQKVEMKERGERYDDGRREPLNGRRNLKDNRGRPQFSFGNRNRFGCHGKQLDPKFGNSGQTPQRLHQPTVKKNRVPLIDDFEYRRNLPAFQGTEQYLRDQTKSSDLDYSESDSEEGSLNSNTPVVCNNEITNPDISSPLISSLDLLMSYGSSGSDGDECDEPNPNVAMKRKAPSLNDHKELRPNECPLKVPKLEQLPEPDLHSQDDDDDDDSGPDEYSSKLPVPDFILKDSTKPVNNKIIDVIPKIQNLEQKSKPDTEKKEYVNIIKKGTKKRARHRNRKTVESANENGKNVENGKVAEEKDRVTDEKQPTVAIPPTRKRFRRPTLLEKLLAPEIRHERNVILQCIRHVVNNNYFDIGSASKAATTARQPG